MTIHETAAKIAAVNARIAHMAQTSNDECIRMSARIDELEGALRLIEFNLADYPTTICTRCAEIARAILAKGN